ncbi:MAG: tRNA (adenosine(37)-N6)-threonylcarbamoyltransferase complex dimerization subunit type 1 TsaB [Chlamydiae bacterium CG10_big_fil_rev_8_21_14_0_10_35_9]|nr:MAG: tRNA (adenosine(37)-N6)-threonylcarbamoyltransferase complex dimerization subunit type 1 TsaB [Chlamydiae bacterium CG10_big_fil_rev_8_21_14_0_10_35_9]
MNHQGLILETSTDSSVIAVLKNGKVNEHVFLENKRQLSNDTFKAIIDFFPDPSSIDFVCTGIGPGSYTGSRVAVTIAKSLCYSLNIPLITFSSLKAFTPDISGSFFILLDAKIDGIFVLEGKKEGPSASFKGPYLSKIDQFIQKNMQNPTILCSCETEILKKKIDHNNARWMSLKPNIDFLSHYLWGKWLNKKFTNLDDLEILYLRGS